MSTKGRIERIQDAVHGLMEFKGMETVVLQLLRTPELQRLRKVRQTGLANFVFPGAEHSRFVHSLGTAYLAIRFAKHLREESADFLIELLRPNDASIRDLAVAALCHDLGHGPLSHAWEREVIDGGDRYDVDKWARVLGLDTDSGIKYQGLKWHELVTQSFLAWEDGMLHKLLEIDDVGLSKRIRYLLMGKYYPPYLPALLSSDVDVDRADFLRRDSHQTGVSYGWFDLDRLISTSKIGAIQNKLVIGFDSRKSVRVIEEFLLARRALYENVYYHKTVRAAEGMVGLFFKRLKEVSSGGGLEIQLPKSEINDTILTIINGNAVGPEKLLMLDDHSLWAFIEQIAKSKSVESVLQDLAIRITSRDLFKQVPCDPEKVQEFLNMRGKEELLNAINKYKPEYYFIADPYGFNLISKKTANSVYLIDSRNAFPIGDRHNLQESITGSKGIRIFTIQEAVEPLRKLIG